MNRYLKKAVAGATLFAISALALAAPNSLVGTWRSDDESAGSSKGTMVIKADGSIDMQPDGFPVSSGHYEVHGPFLDVDMGKEMGKASIAYSLGKGGKTFDAQYSDGTRQKFKKVEKK
jgi:hypothetical protein